MFELVKSILFPQKPKRENTIENIFKGKRNFGSETMVIGEEGEKVSFLNGSIVRLKATGEVGRVYNAYVNSRKETAVVWISFPAEGYENTCDGDGRYAKGVRPRHLELIKPSNSLVDYLDLPTSGQLTQGEKSENTHHGI